jgi:hypothetical protein
MSWRTACQAREPTPKTQGEDDVGQSGCQTPPPDQGAATVGSEPSMFIVTKFQCSYSG